MSHQVEAAVAVGGEGAVGVVGLGVMGHPIAANILRNGFAVHITGRTRGKYSELIASGAVWHNTPRSLAEAVTVLVSMLPDLLQVEEVLSGSGRDPGGQRLRPAPHHRFHFVSDRGPRAWPAVGS